MEFKYRAGEDLPSSPVRSYSTTMPAAPVRITGGENRRSDLVPIQMTGRDSLRREIMKEVIREEIMAMRREIEEEVRMEIAIERELALRTNAGRISLSSSLLSQQNLQRTVRLPPRTQQLPERRLAEKPVHISYAPISYRNSIAAVAVGNDDTRLVSEVGGGEEEVLFKSSTENILAGSKRKATIDSELLHIAACRKRAQNLFRCDLCGVTANSEQSLNDHLEGRKHKAKAREVKNVKKGIAAAPNATNGAASSEPVSEPVEREEQQQPQDGPEVLKVTSFRCQLCNVICNSEIMLGIHLKGKKHVALVKRLAPQSDENKEDVATVTEDPEVVDSPAKPTS